MREAPPATSRVMLVEDSPADVFLVQRRARGRPRDLALEVVDSGSEAWRLLAERAADELPELLILDVNLPGLSGYEILSRLRAERDDIRLPVVVLSTSERERDVLAAYEAGANGYVCKPTQLEEYERAVDSIFDFWLDAAEKPAPPRRG